jgi:hypothetical protein
MPRKSDRSDAPKRARRKGHPEPRRDDTTSPAPEPGSSRVEQVDDQTGRSDREAGVGRPLQLDAEPAGQERPI